mgnify:CR=1 FL=1
MLDPPTPAPTAPTALPTTWLRFQPTDLLVIMQHACMGYLVRSEAIGDFLWTGAHFIVMRAH